jgi:formate hydrogenlyase subunit 6/NADH:ubiquinone oxidoreductase subunit I
MKILDKTKLSQFLEGLGREFQVIAPLHEGKDILFGEFDASKLVSDYVGKTRLSPKEYLFPQKEKLFTFEENKRIEIKANLDETKRVIWGIRPCDLSGIKILSEVYLSDYIDPYYQARRANILLLGLNCNEAEQSCFCSSLGIGPFAREGFDLLFTDLGDTFLVEIGSKAGENLIEQAANLFTSAVSKDEEKAELLEEKSKKTFRTSIDLEKIKAKIATALNNHVWDEEAGKCILCGGCNWVCPTCHCFNVEDINAEHKTQRVRYWDSCQLGGFTQMAAYNSRVTQAERLRQRIYHKFSYNPDRYKGQTGCTGCGRCIDVCPAGIDITYILGRVANE